MAINKRGTCVKELDDCRNGLLSIWKIDDSQGYTTFDASAKDVIKKSEYTYEELPIKRAGKQ